DDSETEEQEDCLDSDKILKDIQKNVRVIPGLLKQLETIKQSMSLLSDKYDTLLTEHEKSKIKIKTLEKTVEHISNKCTFLEKCNAPWNNVCTTLSSQLLPGENVKEVVTKIGNMINVSSDDIDFVRRNQPRKQGVKTSSIIVGFKSSGTESRDAWLAQRRKLADVTSDKITGDLTKATRTLLWKTKKELNNKYKYIWVSKGKILVKKTEDENSIWVRSDGDVNDLLKT
ncbi:hypothetical protein SFRURICE_010298, partial [Spodoptera frugiperda]